MHAHHKPSSRGGLTLHKSIRFNASTRIMQSLNKLHTVSKAPTVHVPVLMPEPLITAALRMKSAAPVLSSLLRNKCTPLHTYILYIYIHPKAFTHTGPSGVLWYHNMVCFLWPVIAERSWHMLAPSWISSACHCHSTAG